MKSRRESTQSLSIQNHQFEQLKDMTVVQSSLITHINSDLPIVNHLKDLPTSHYENNKRYTTFFLRFYFKPKNLINFMLGVNGIFGFLFKSISSNLACLGFQNSHVILLFLIYIFFSKGWVEFK